MATHRIDELTFDQLKRAVALVDCLPDAAAVDPVALFFGVADVMQRLKPPGLPPVYRVSVELSERVAPVPGWRSSASTSALVACMRAHLKARLNSTHIELPDHG